jgi:hypothetical protein
MLRNRRWPVIGIVHVAVLFALAGCGGGGSIDRYIPESEKARHSLEAALNSWKGGAPLKTIESGGHKIDVFDARWRGGAKLENFEIVSEQPGDPHPTFLVKTRIKGTDEESSYRVMGIDPILIFREQEYQKATGM